VAGHPAVNEAEVLLGHPRTTLESVMI
jgi:hypothetical protein